ncbi:MAG: DoxX family membrane protein [Flavobacterium circumlabens]|uniref:Membrane protein n=1 Tax=Flavobacterium circumlabens TaxID=2133765 RepID=A0A4Y7UD22_9FLAO|nr:DoxX family membrane protein [Flavobacterium circumlabens]TCN57362.1 putative membrane protein [Flavobacterium circumlabens]TEB43692.1 DoxX family membrane protein [Flavobacterium circumlabens]
MNLPWHLYVMAFLYIIAGINHFKNPGMYIRIIPPFFPNPKLLNMLSGVAEIILGILLTLPFFTPYAAWGIIALLIAVFPANLYMFQKKKGGFSLLKFILLIRLPLQIVLILWAYQYTH